MDKSQKLYYSNGKLLLTGEYFVMFGAKALAIPVKYGQSIKITEHTEYNKLVWIAKEFGKEWFSAVFELKTLAIEKTSDTATASRLQKILTEAIYLNPTIIKERGGILVETNLNFNRNWGLGTSSTLIANIALWANIDPFQLHWKVSGGSGYDIACAAVSTAIIYKVQDQKPEMEFVPYNPAYQNHIFFIYLEKKQDSAVSIESIREKKERFSNEIQHVSHLTNKFTNATTLSEAIVIAREHEILLGKILKLPPVQNKLFTDFSGVVKSLGAWGGDFVMALSPWDRSLVEQYFQSKGYFTIIPFQEMIIQAN